MRYNVGETVAFIHFVIDGEHRKEAQSYRTFWTPIPWEDRVISTTIKHMSCIQHHKVPNFLPNNREDYDGFIFDDLCGHYWHNQYPRSSYRENSTVSDWLVSIQPNVGETYDSMFANNTIIKMCDLRYYLQGLLYAINKVYKTNTSERHQLSELYNTTVLQFEVSTGLIVIPKQLYHDGIAMEGCFNVTIEDKAKHIKELVTNLSVKRSDFTNQ